MSCTSGWHSAGTKQLNTKGHKRQDMKNLKALFSAIFIFLFLAIVAAKPFGRHGHYFRPSADQPSGPLHGTHLLKSSKSSESKESSESSESEESVRTTTPVVIHKTTTPEITSEKTTPVVIPETTADIIGAKTTPVVIPETTPDITRENTTPIPVNKSTTEVTTACGDTCFTINVTTARRGDN
ncbi:hypothetical protein AGIG_G21024 [Arapaima gigas]